MSVKNSKTGAGQAELFPRVLGEKQVTEARQKAEAAKELDDATRKMLRREEDVHKKMLIEREEENFSNLFALKCSNGWLKIYDNSAMILSSWLDGRLGRPYNRADDNGFGTKAKYGVVSILPDKVQELIQALDYANVKLSYDDEWMLEFQLGERISQEDMVRMLHEDELIIDKTNKLVMPKVYLSSEKPSMCQFRNRQEYQLKRHHLSFQISSIIKRIFIPSWSCSG